MSEENVEIVRRAIEAVTRKPKPDFDTVNALFHPDHELAAFVQMLEGGVAEGARGYRDWLTELDETYERWENKVEQIRTIDGDRVLVATLFTAVSKRGGVPIEQSTTTIVTVREGKVVRSEVYHSREQALEGAGLSE